MKKMITRQDYMNDKATHREYYGQFVTDEIKQEVLREIGKMELMSSTDEHLNDIELFKWYWQLSRKTVNDLKASGEVHANTLSVAVCIHKEAARQIIEEIENEQDKVMEIIATVE